jgi:hypothetical protein
MIPARGISPSRSSKAERSVSWSRRAPTAREGIIIAREKSQPITGNQPTTQLATILATKNIQNSCRRARPLNTAYFFIQPIQCSFITSKSMSFVISALIKPPYELMQSFPAVKIYKAGIYPCVQNFLRCNLLILVIMADFSAHRNITIHFFEKSYKYLLF